MTKGLKIAVGVFLATGFVACEKCQKPVQEEDPFVNTTMDNRDVLRDNDNTSNPFVFGQRGDDPSTDPSKPGNSITGGSGVDPNGDHGGIVDPDEDEDFDKDSDGK